MKSDYLPAEIFKEMTAEAISKLNVPRAHLLKVLSEYTGIERENLWYYLSKGAKNAHQSAIDALKMLLFGVRTDEKDDLTARVQEGARADHEEYITLINTMASSTGKQVWSVCLALARVTGTYPELFYRAYNGKSKDLERQVFEKVQIFAEEVRTTGRLDNKAHMYTDAIKAIEVFNDIKNKWKLSNQETKRLIANFSEMPYSSVRASFRKSQKKIKTEIYTAMLALYAARYRRAEAKEKARRPLPAEKAIFNDIKKKWKLSDQEAKRLIANFSEMPYSSVKASFRRGKDKADTGFYQTLVALYNSGYTRTEAKEKAQRPIPAGYVHVKKARNLYAKIKHQGNLTDLDTRTIISRVTGVRKEAIRQALENGRKYVKETLAEKIAEVAEGFRYDRSREYSPGDLLYHPVFGYGIVLQMLPKQMMEVEFTSLETATLRHSLTEDPVFNRDPEQIDLSIYIA